MKEFYLYWLCTTAAITVWFLPYQTHPVHTFNSPLCSTIPIHATDNRGVMTLTKKKSMDFVDNNNWNDILLGVFLCWCLGWFMPVGYRWHTFFIFSAVVSSQQWQQWINFSFKGQYLPQISRGIFTFIRAFFFPTFSKCMSSFMSNSYI